MKQDITTYSEAAEQLGVSNDVITALTQAHNIDPKPVPRNGMAKGLNARDMAVLRRALNLRKGERVRKASAAASA